MKTYHPNLIKNVVLLGSSGAGKTTLSEAMAFEGKVIDRRGSIDSDNTLSDYTDIEHIYKRSIYPSQLFSEFNGFKLNIIDTPGSDDFCGGLFSAFKVADVGVMVIDAEDGFDAGTEIQARYARKHEKPIIAVINQLDSDKASWENAYESLKSNSQVKTAIVQYPINTGAQFDGFIDVLLMKWYKFEGDTGKRTEFPIPTEEVERAGVLHNELVEAAAENDENLMELYFDKGELSQDEIRGGLKLGIANRDVIPVMCTSGKKNIGTKRLMEFITYVAPGPIESPKFTTKDGEELDVDIEGVPTIFIYKTTIEPHLGEVSYFRVITGTIKEGMELINNSNGHKEKISQLYVAAGKSRVKVSELMAGDIGCTVKLKLTKTNHTLTESSVSWQIEDIKYPNHRYRTAVRPINLSDEEKLGELLHRAHHEDPTIVVEYSKELKQVILHGQGEHHLNILKWQIANVNKIEIEYFAPRIPYRETITKLSTASYRHKKQSGGSGQFGEVSILILPYIEGEEVKNKFKADGKDLTMNIRSSESIDLEWGGKLVFHNCIVGGAIDTRFLPAVVKGIMEKMENGPLTGSYARDITVYLYDGKMHAVDSNEISFKLAGRSAFKEAFKNAGAKIMEPIYNIEILVPTDKTGDVMGDLQTRRAMIEGMSSDNGLEVITARVPLAEMYRYSTTLSSLTNGRASFAMKFGSYEQAPNEVQSKLLKSYEDTDKED